MKNILTFIAVAMMCAIWSAKSMASDAGAKEAALKYAVIVAATTPYSVRNNYYHGYLPKGDHHYVKMDFYRGNDYALIVGGCEDAYDVDVAIYDDEGNLVARDRDASKVAIAKLHPPKTATYYVKITMYNSTAGGAHWALVTAYK